VRKGGFVLVISILALTAGCSSGGGALSGNGGGSVSPGHGSPKAAVEGFITDLESGNGSTAWCGYLYAPDRSFRQEGITVTGTFALGNQFIDGTSALVAVTGDLCAHADLRSTTSIACNKNSDPNKGLPTSANTFSEAYAAASVSFGTVTAPCHEVKGSWYLDVDVLVVSGTPTTSPTTTPTTTPSTVPSTVPTSTPTTSPSPATTIATTTTTTAGLSAAVLAPFVGTWGAHETTLVIDSTGTGHWSYADLTLCPSCSFASAPVSTVVFVLTSGTSADAKGSITSSSDPKNYTVGEPLELMLMAGSPGQLLDVKSTGGSTLFCNSTSAGQCGA
jgi:hypothetical protein